MGTSLKFVKKEKIKRKCRREKFPKKNKMSILFIRSKKAAGLNKRVHSVVIPNIGN